MVVFYYPGMAGALADLFVGLLRNVPDNDGSDISVVEAASKGDIDRVRAVVERDPSKVSTADEFDFISNIYFMNHNYTFYFR